MSDWLKQIFEKVKHFNVSVDEYKKDTVIQSLPSLTFVNRAKKLIEDKKYEEAKNLLIKALELPQKDALVYKYLGLIYEKQNDFAASVEAYQTSADINPHDKSIWQKLGFALVALGKFEEASKSFDNSNKISPLNTDTFTGWGMALMKLKNYEEAKEKFNQASKINKYNFSAIFLASVMDVKLGDYDSAEMKLTFLANIAPNETNTFEFANLKFLKGNYESAMHYALKSLDYNPNMLPAYILLGKLYAMNFDKDNSLSYFQTAESRDLITSALYFEWSMALEKFQNYEEAREKLLKAVELDSENIEIASHLGLCCVTLGYIEEARPILEKVLTNDPENHTVKQALGIIAYKNSDTEKAIHLLKGSLDDSDDDFINYYYLAKCYERLNDVIKIKDNYETAIRKNHKYIKAYIDYARYLMLSQNNIEAQRKLRKALKADENNVEILNLLFYTGYKLVKENICEYNIKENVAIAKKIEAINPDLFEYPDEKAELLEILKTFKESD